MGECFYAKGQYSESIGWYKKAIAFMDNEDIKFNMEDGRLNIVSTFIEREMQENFRQLSEKSRKFLSTGEYLYRIHQNNPTIDFAPIMIEFCKVVENELNEILKRKKIIDKRKNYTLGQLLYELEREKTNQFKDFITVLRTILQFRNGSAHTGSTDKNKTQKVRELLFEEGWLNYIENKKMITVLYRITSIN
jgi:tetratricopeptide (TPR) repeat protein